MLPVFVLERILGKLTTLKIFALILLRLYKKLIQQNHKLLSCLLSLTLVFAPVFVRAQDVIVEAEWGYTVQLILNCHCLIVSILEVRLNFSVVTMLSF